jgi:hypothetical protein
MADMRPGFNRMRGCRPHTNEGILTVNESLAGHRSLMNQDAGICSQVSQLN